MIRSFPNDRRTKRKRPLTPRVSSTSRFFFELRSGSAKKQSYTKKTTSFVYLSIHLLFSPPLSRSSILLFETDFDSSNTKRERAREKEREKTKKEEHTAGEVWRERERERQRWKTSVSFLLFSLYSPFFGIRDLSSITAFSSHAHPCIFL